jgi:hypothetical protein
VAPAFRAWVAKAWRTGGTRALDGYSRLRIGVTSRILDFSNPWHGRMAVFGVKQS